MNQPVQKLKHQGCIRIALRNRHQVYILMLNMAERRRAKRQDGRSDLGVGYDLDAEDVCEAGTAIVAKSAEYKVFAFLIKY